MTSGPGSERRRQLRHRFDRRVRVERHRLAGDPLRELRRTLVERFLVRNLRKTSGPILEVGPGPGRFTPVLLRFGRPTVLLDLSTKMLRAARDAVEGTRVRPRRKPWAYVRGAAEGFPMLRDRTFGAIVILGTLGYLGFEGVQALQGAARVLRPGGILITETTCATGSVFEVFPGDPRGAKTLLENPTRYHVWEIFRQGHQPFDPPRFAPLEWRFWRPPEVTEAVERQGFEVLERMSVAPMLGNQVRLLQTLYKSRRAWNTTLAIEEDAGHRPECFGLGPAFLLSAQLAGS